jgi:hypothetical protein
MLKPAPVLHLHGIENYSQRKFNADCPQARRGVASVKSGD